LASAPEESWFRVNEGKHPDRLHLLESPNNGEPPKRLVTAKPITPNELHFVRNYGGIPDIDASRYFLKLDGMIRNPQTLTFAELAE
jgi:sulfite oxidase